jgi:putative ABC transport system permease protein
MAMSIRERTREVAVLRTLGFTRQQILSLYLGESIALALIGGLMGVCFAALLLFLARQGPIVLVPASMKVTLPTALFALIVAAFVGLMSALIPSYRASRTQIVEGLRHIG